MPERCPAKMICLPLDNVRRIGEPRNAVAPLSWRDGCLAQRNFPSSRSSATTASASGWSMPVYELPVATYTRRRSESMVGEDETGTPAGANSWTPELLLRYGRGSSFTV